MKYFYPLSLMLLLLASCGKDDEKAIDRSKTDWAFYKLNGEVKALSEKSYETFDGKTKGPTKHEIMSEHNRDLTFNEEGILIAEKAWFNDAKPFEEIHYKGKDFKQSQLQYVNGSPSLRTEYVWDKSGKNNLSVIRRNADNSPFDKVVMKYKNNKLIERITYNQQDNPTGRVTYFYDAKGNLKGENNYMSADIVQYKTEYAYNDKQQKISEKHFDINGKLDYETKFTYHGDKLVSSEVYNAEGEVTYTEKKAYDNKGNVVSEYTFDKFDGKHMRDVYKYDSNGNKTAWEVYEGDQLKMKASYTFDKHGNMTKVLAVDGESNVKDSRIYNYEYDKLGNWTRKLFIHNDRPMIITERKITYFQE